MSKHTLDFSKAPGHRMLAQMGKKVLRPGGKELTLKLVDALNISGRDDIAEFAPGRGSTASLLLARQPKSYIGIEADSDAVASLQKKIKGGNISFIERNAAQTGLSDGSKDKVLAEAMLTMQADHRKTEIVREAHRILKSGGLYAIHELGLFPGELNEATKAAIQKDLAISMKVNARPLTTGEWKRLLENEGFRIKSVATNPMRLLEAGRLIGDEGFCGFLKITFHIMAKPQAATRILQMRRIFKKHRKNMNAVAIVAEKI